MVAVAQQFPLPRGRVLVRVSGTVPRGKRYVEVREVFWPQGVAEGKLFLSVDPAVESVDICSGQMRRGGRRRRIVAAGIDALRDATTALRWYRRGERPAQTC